MLVHCCSHCRRGEVGHDTGVFNTHVCNRVGGVVVVPVVVGGSIQGYGGELFRMFANFNGVALFY